MVSPHYSQCNKPALLKSSTPVAFLMSLSRIDKRISVDLKCAFGVLTWRLLGELVGWAQVGIEEGDDTEGIIIQGLVFILSE